MATSVTISVGDRHIRETNEAIQVAVATGKPVTVTNTLSRHNLG